MRLFAMFAFLPVVLTAQVAASPDALDALVRDSPFLAVPGGASAAGDGGPLEFRSVVFEQGRYFFSLYDQGSRQAHWVAIGQETEAPFVVRSYDREQDIVTVEHHGRSLSLKLQTAQIGGPGPGGPGPGPSPLPTAQELNQGATPPANAGAAQSVPAAANQAESQRLQELADELRRRRQQPVQPSRN